MNEMLAYQFLCHTHTYYFSIYIRVSVRGVACEFCFLFLVFCVLGNICHKLPEVLYRLSRLLHIFARNHFSSGEQMPWHY